MMGIAHPDSRLAVTTTMGVGELSALNGVGGAYTEQVKLIHVVGTTSREAQAKHAMIHHCMGPDPDHRVCSLFPLGTSWTLIVRHLDIRKDFKLRQMCICIHRQWRNCSFGD